MKCCSPLFFRLIGVLMLASMAVRAQSPEPPAQAVEGPPLAAGTYAEIATSKGTIVCRLLPDEAPKTVENFIQLATGKKAWTDPRDGKEKRRPLYNGLTFHRVIKNFMIQGGDPLGTGEGGPGFAIDDEISPNLHFERPGMLAMAKRSFPNSGGSQFFITTAPAPWLEGKYAIFGEVVQGQEVVNAISELPVDENDKPQTPVIIQKLTIQVIGSQNSGK